jgi:hypothetical protein
MLAAHDGRKGAAMLLLRGNADIHLLSVVSYCPCLLPYFN